MSPRPGPDGCITAVTLSRYAMLSDVSHPMPPAGPSGPPASGDPYGTPPDPYGQPPAPRGRNRVGLLRRVVSIGVFAVVAGSAAYGYFTSADRDETGAVVDGGAVAADELAVGDCINEPDGVEFTSISAVACSEAHDYEAFHEFEASGGDAYPGDAAMDVEAEKCLEAFGSYVGVAYEVSSLDYLIFAPVAQAWEMGDRTVSCVLFDPAAALTGSARGIAR